MVRHIVYSEAIGVLGIVFTDGRAALVSTEKQQGEGSRQVMRGHWLPAAEHGQVLQGRCHFTSQTLFGASLLTLSTHSLTRASLRFSRDVTIQLLQSLCRCGLPKVRETPSKPIYGL
jgi:hypothetical protein